MIGQAEAALVYSFLTQNVQRELLDLPTVSFGGGGVWKGSDEFARNRARRAFEQTYLPKLKEFAPRVPFEFRYGPDIALPEYDLQRSGFALGKITAFQTYSDSGALQLRFVIPATMSWSAQFDPPDLFWGILIDDAERVVAQIREAATRADHLRGQSDYRWLKAVMILEASRIDPDTGRIDLRLKRVSLYSRDLRTKLHDFPSPTPEPEPYLDATVPPKLEVPSPAPFDMVMVHLKQIQAQTDQTPESVYEALWQLVDARDKAFYGKPNSWDGFVPNNSRHPFFPRGGAERNEKSKAAFARWARAYAAGLPDLMLSIPSNASSNDSGGIRVMAVGGEPQPTGLDAFVKANGLQADQVVRLRDTDALAILPNRASLYTVVLTKQEMTRYPGQLPTISSLFRTGPAQMAARDDAPQQLVAIPLEPLETVISFGGTVVARRTYQDIPHLDGSSFTAPAPAKPAKAPVPAAASTATSQLDAALIDLIAAREAGSRLSPEALAYIVLRRWNIENESPRPSGGRFFLIGKRQPTADEALGMGKSFVAWAETHAPALPVKVTVSGEIKPNSNPRPASWDTMSCLGKSLSSAADRQTQTQILRSDIGDCDRKRAAAGEGRQSWTPADERRCDALRVTGAVLDYLQGFKGACRPASQNLPFPDPAKLSIRIPHSLAMPTLTRHPGDIRPVSAEAVLTINSVAVSDTAPLASDLLPPEILALFDWRRARPTQPAKGEYVTMNASFVEARFRDESNNQVTRLGPEFGRKSRGAGARVPRSEEIKCGGAEKGRTVWT